MNHSHMHTHSGGGAGRPLFWTCTTCTFHNRNVSAHSCDVCASPKTFHCDEGDSRSGWTCGGCTFQENKLSSSSCEICNRPKFESNAATATPYLSPADCVRDLQEFMDFGGAGADSKLISKLDLIIANQMGDKDFNVDLINKGICNQLIRLFGMPLTETIATKLFTIINFLCRYDGMTAQTCIDSNIAELGQKGMCEVVASVFANHLDSSSATTMACAAIRSLAYLDGNSEKLGVADCCQNIIMALVFHESNESICENACFAISNLCQDHSSSNRVKFGTAQMGVAMLNILTRHLNNADICDRACRAITNICSNNNTNTAKFRNQIQEAVINVLVRHESNAEVCEFACKAMAILYDASDVTHDSVGIKISEIVTDLLTRHVENVTFCQSATLVVACLSVNEACMIDLSASIYFLVAVLERHQNDAEICSNLCVAMSNLYRDYDENIKTIDLFVALVLSVLMHHQKNAVVCNQVCWLLKNMSQNSIDNQVVLGESGCCELMANVLAVHVLNESTCKQICLVISNLCCYESSQAKLMHLGVCDLLIQALSHHKGQRDICESAAAALEIVMRGNDNANFATAIDNYLEDDNSSDITNSSGDSSANPSQPLSSESASGGGGTSPSPRSPTSPVTPGSPDWRTHLVKAGGYLPPEASNSFVSPETASSIKESCDTFFEKRGVTIMLMRAVRDLCLKINNNKEYWSIGRVCAVLIGNHEMLKIPPKSLFLSSIRPFSDSNSTIANSCPGLTPWEILTNLKNAKDPDVMKQKLLDLGILFDSSKLSCCFHHELEELAELLKSSRWGEDIKPETTLTFSAKCSLIDLLRSDYPDSSCRHPQLNISYEEAVGEKANKFISFAYDDNFIDLVGSLDQFFLLNQQYTEDSTLFWVDLFVNNQWNALNKPFEWWATTFCDAVKSIGHTVCFFSSYKKPTIMTRAWCLFEVYCSVKSNCKFEVTMSTADKKLFLDDVSGDVESHINEMFANIDCERSKCFNLEDRERIFEVVREVGFAKINSMVFEQLRGWVVNITKEEINICNISINENAARRSQNMDYIRYLNLQNTLGRLYLGQGNYSAAEPLLVQCLEARKNELGQSHPDSLSSISSLAELYNKQGLFETAELLYTQCLELRKIKLGVAHPQTLSCLNSLANLYWYQGHYERAERLFIEVLETRKATLGELHTDTLSSLNDLAMLYCKEEKYHLAEPLLIQCLEARKIKFGNNHPDTLHTVNHLAIFYNKLGKCELAEPLFVEVLENCKVKLGINHPDTMMAINNLAVLYESQMQYEKAEPLLIECLEARKANLRSDHPNTLTSMNNLANLYFMQGNYGLAEPLFKACLEARQKKLGVDHPDTIDSINNLQNLYEDRDYNRRNALALELETTLSMDTRDMQLPEDFSAAHSWHCPVCTFINQVSSESGGVNDTCDICGSEKV